MITPRDGATFEWAGELVAISWQGEDGVLRYTTDGSDPTRESPVYEGPFTISDSTVVKAKAFGDQFFDYRFEDQGRDFVHDRGGDYSLHAGWKRA